MLQEAYYRHAIYFKVTLQEKPWYASISRDSHRSKSSTERKKSVDKVPPKSDVSVSEEKLKKKKRHKHRHKHRSRSTEKKKRHKKRKRDRSSSHERLESLDDNSEMERLKKQKLEKLRAERLMREAKERARFESLNAKKVDENPKQEYNSQFNPQIARQNRH